MIEKELLAYTAGIIDGEGYIGLIPNSAKLASSKYSFSPKIKVTSVARELPLFLHKNFGGHLDKVRHHKQENHRDSSTWTLSNKVNVIPFLQKVLPYLVIKKRQAKIVIEYVESCSYKAIRTRVKIEKEKEIEKRLNFYTELRSLNYRGIPPATTK